MPFVIILVLLAYWQTIKKDFDHLKYRETKDAILKGMAMFIVIFIIVSLPIGYHFWMNPEDFLGDLFSKMTSKKSKLICKSIHN